MKTPSYQGKVAAITGAGSGIGRGLALALARRGCDVALSDVDERGLAETAQMVAGAGARASTRRVDVADADDVRAWADVVVAEHGRVNLVFNNAGIAYSATAWGAEDVDFRRLIDVNFWGVVHGTRAFLPHLEASGDGHVVNTSSVFGLIAFPGQSTYNSAKFAVRGFTEALGIELEITGSPVTATCVHPGGIKTNIARSAKVHPSLAALGVDVERGGRDFEKAFRLTPDEAAEIILRGVAKNARRVLVGADARLIDLAQRLLPGSYHGFIARMGRRSLKPPARARARTSP